MDYISNNDIQKKYKRFEYDIHTYCRMVLFHVYITYVTGQSNSSCTFENKGLSVTCGWGKRGSTKYQWKLRKGKTPSYHTGPDRDHTTASGNYNFERS